MPLNYQRKLVKDQGKTSISETDGMILTRRRVRGYQFKSQKAEPRRNPTAYRPLNDRMERLTDAALPSPNADAFDLEDIGFAEMFKE